MTFSDHSAGVTGVCFNALGKVVVSCSMDGTVRAFDLHRSINLSVIRCMSNLIQIRFVVQMLLQSIWIAMWCDTTFETHTSLLCTAALHYAA